jgi:hypothetical protein
MLEIYRHRRRRCPTASQSIAIVARAVSANEHTNDGEEKKLRHKYCGAAVLNTRV